MRVSFYKAATTAGGAIGALVNNKATRPVGRSILAAFNLITGNKALHKRGLERGDGGIITAFTGPPLSVVPIALVTMALFPVMGPLSIVFGAAAGLVWSVTPALAQARYLISKDKDKKAHMQAPHQ